MDALYTAEAGSTGSGRQGHVRSSDGRIDLELAPPAALGGSGNGSNPEQLFASGYAACFHSALLGTSRSRKIAIPDSSVSARVSIGRLEGAAYGIAVELHVSLPGIEGSVARELAASAHEVCPYSNATRGNIDVTIVIDE